MSDPRRSGLRSAQELDEALENASSLRHLQLEGPSIDDAMIERIATTGALQAVETLSLSRMDSCDAWIARLARSHIFRGVRLLLVDQAGLTVEGIRALAVAEPGALVELALFNRFPGVGRPNRIDDEALRVLASASSPRRIETLDVSYNPVGRTGIECLSSPSLPALRRVTAWRTNLTADDAKALAGRTAFHLHTDFDPRTIDYSQE